jgi:hypothetical protein
MVPRWVREAQMIHRGAPTAAHSRRTLLLAHKTMQQMLTKLLAWLPGLLRVQVSATHTAHAAHAA